MKYSAIYVPGLGDRMPTGQRRVVSLWRFLGVEPHFIHMNWADGKPFDTKLDKIIAKIDEQHAKGRTVFLVGASAGGGAVINAFAARKDKVGGVVAISGKINNPEGIGPKYSGPNPAFVESAYMVQPSLDKLDFEHDRPRIQSRYAFFDPIVPMSDSKVIGAINKTVPSVGHATTIATQLLFGAPFFLRWLKHSH
jgi:pimeloyl-ACP methyl ester carboxylesterase